MPVKAPTEEEYNEALDACFKAEQALKSRWEGLTEEDKKFVKEDSELDAGNEREKILEKEPKEKELTDEALNALQTCQKEYEGILRWLESALARPKPE